MATEWFFQIEGKVHGPLTASQAETLIDVGKIHPETLAREGKNGQWTRAANFSGLSVSRQNEEATEPRKAGKKAVFVPDPKKKTEKVTAKPSTITACRRMDKAFTGFAVAALIGALLVGSRFPDTFATCLIGSLFLFGGGVMFRALAEILESTSGGIGSGESS